MRGAEGHHNLEGRALALGAFNAHRAAVQPNKFLHEREPDAGAFVGTRPRRAHAMESLENPRQLHGGNARSGVAHGQAGLTGA